VTCKNREQNISKLVTHIRTKIRSNNTLSSIFKNSLSQSSISSLNIVRSSSPSITGGGGGSFWWWSHHSISFSKHGSLRLGSGMISGSTSTFGSFPIPRSVQIVQGKLSQINSKADYTKKKHHWLQCNGSDMHSSMATPFIQHSSGKEIFAKCSLGHKQWLSTFAQTIYHCRKLQSEVSLQLRQKFFKM